MERAFFFFFALLLLDCDWGGSRSGGAFPLRLAEGGRGRVTAQLGNRRGKKEPNLGFGSMDLAPPSMRCSGVGWRLGAVLYRRVKDFGCFQPAATRLRSGVCRASSSA